MAVQCSQCGRADLMQAQVRSYQCLACGSVTDDNQNLVTPVEPGPNVNNANLPIVELSDLAPVVLAPSGETAPEAPVEPLETVEPEAEPEVPETEVTPTEDELDLANLTPDQLEKIKEIVNG